MKTTPRRVLAAFALTVGVMGPLGTVLAATANAAVITNPIGPSNNGGDNGLGNCGHNSSGGAAHSGGNGNGGGNGGLVGLGGNCGDNSGGGPSAT